MDTPSMSRRGFLTRILIGAAASAVTVTQAEAFGRSRSDRGRNFGRNGNRGFQAYEYPPGNDMSAHRLPHRYDPGQIGRRRRRRPCASLPGQGCR